MVTTLVHFASDSVLLDDGGAMTSATERATRSARATLAIRPPSRKASKEWEEAADRKAEMSALHVAIVLRMPSSPRCEGHKGSGEYLMAHMELRISM